MHGGDLSKRWIFNVNIKALTLINKSTAISCHINNGLLTQLPDCLVQCLEFLRDIRDILNRAIIGDNTILHIIVPKSQINEISQQPRVHNLEFPSKDTARINIGSIWFKTFVEAEDLRCTGRGHWRNEERIA